MPLTNKRDLIYVAGHTGMVGSSLVRQLKQLGYDNLLLRSHAELDLRDQAQVEEFIGREKPAFIFLAAARVGGINANNTRPAEFIYDNLMIAANVVHAAWRAGVQRMLFLGSSCIYPRDCPQPIREEYLLGGPLESTNEPYALAKIAGLKLCESYNRQHGTRYVSAMPTNLYGPMDSYDLAESHVVPALIRKAHEAKVRGESEMLVWGTGNPKREFLYVDDMAEACITLMEAPIEHGVYNIGTGRDLTIRELAEIVAETVGFTGRLRFEHDKPDGTPRKLLDICRMEALGWRARTDLRDGLRKTYEDFLKRYENA